MTDPNRAHTAFAERLRRAIEHQKLTTRQFAEKCGIPLRTLQNYISGDREPGAAALEKMARSGIDVNWLLVGQDTPPDFEHEAPGIIYSTIAKISLDNSGKERESDIIARSGMQDHIVYSASKSVDKFNAEYISESGKSYTLLELLNLFEGAAQEKLNLAMNIISLGIEPPDKLQELGDDMVSSVVEKTLLGALGDGASASVASAVALVEEQRSALRRGSTLIAGQGPQ